MQTLKRYTLVANDNYKDITCLVEIDKNEFE